MGAAPQNAPLRDSLQDSLEDESEAVREEPLQRPALDNDTEASSEDDDQGVPEQVQAPNKAIQYRQAIEGAHAVFAGERQGTDEYTESGLQHQLRVDENKALKQSLGVGGTWELRRVKGKLKRAAKRDARGSDKSWKDLYRTKKSNNDKVRAHADYRAQKQQDPNKLRKANNAELKAKIKQESMNRFGDNEEVKREKKAWRTRQYIDKRAFIDGEDGRNRARAEVQRKSDNRELKEDIELLHKDSGYWKRRRLYRGQKQASAATAPAKARAQHTLRVRRNKKLKKSLAGQEDAKQKYKDQKEKSPEALKKAAKETSKSSAQQANQELKNSLGMRDPEDIWSTSGADEQRQKTYWTQFKVWSSKSRIRRNKHLKKLTNKSEYQALKYSAEDVESALDAGALADSVDGVNGLVTPGGKAAVAVTEAVQDGKKAAEGATPGEIKQLADVKLKQLGTKYYQPVEGGEWTTNKPADFDTNSAKYKTTTVGGQTNQAGAIIGALTPVLSITQSSMVLSDGAKKSHSSDFATREQGHDQIDKGVYGMTSALIAGGGAGVNVARTFMKTPALAAQLGDILPVFKLATSLVKVVQISHRLDGVRRRLAKIRKLRATQGLKESSPVVWQSLKGARRADRHLLGTSSVEMFATLLAAAGSTANLIPGGAIAGGPMVLASGVVNGAKAVYDMGAEAHQANQQFKNHKKVKAAWAEQARGVGNEQEAEARAEKYGARILNTDPKISVQVLINQARGGDTIALRYLETFGITAGALGKEQSVAANLQTSRTSDAALRKLMLKRLGAVENPETLWRQIKEKVSFVREMNYTGHVKRRGW